MELLSQTCDVPKGQLRLQVDGAIMSGATLLPHIQAFCSQPQVHEKTMLELGFAVEVDAANSARVKHVAMHLDVATPTTTGDNVKTDMPRAQKRGAAPPHDGLKKTKKPRRELKHVHEATMVRPPWPSQLQ
jgi:hypothetical protein